MCYNELIFWKGGCSYEGRTTLSPGTYHPQGPAGPAGGHPWVYAGEVTELTGPVEDGGLTDIIGSKGAYLGHRLL